jgi:hypothetical protein
MEEREDNAIYKVVVNMKSSIRSGLPIGSSRWAGERLEKPAARQSV